jgi:uncharacterized protein YjbI with pentapeptide repeats
MDIDCDFSLMEIEFKKMLSVSFVAKKSLRLEKIVGESVMVSGDAETFACRSCQFEGVHFFLFNVISVRLLNSIILKLELKRASVDRNLFMRECKVTVLDMTERINSLESLKIEISEIGIASISLSGIKSSNLASSKFDTLLLTDKTLKDSLLELGNLNISNLAFDQVINFGRILVTQVTIPSTGSLQITSGDFGETNFISCNFSGAKFVFSSGKISGIFVAQSDFPPILTNEDLSHSQAQLAFGQLSAAFQRHGDTVRALEYQAREVEAHFQKLDFFPNGVWSFSFTKLSLWLNKWSNDLGRNWARGILFTFAVGAFFYYALLLSSKEYVHSIGFLDSRLSASFLKFINPLRFYETESLFRLNNSTKPYLTLTPISYFIDFFSRLIIAYGFYQTIQAFRRYGRKS